jgi:hypothetical protein
MIHRLIFRKAGAALFAAMLTLSALAGSVSASAGGAGGNCDTVFVSDHFEQGKWANPGGNIAGLAGYIDPANTGSDDDCTNPVTANDGVNLVLWLSEDNCEGNQCAQISFGVISCDNPGLGWLGQGHGCQRNIWHYFIWFVGEDGTDYRYDLGTTFKPNPWQNHSYELTFAYGQGVWNAYVDGSFISGVLVTSSNLDELNLDITGRKVEGGWQSERWDAGDALSYNGVNPIDTADFTGMESYRGGGVWATPPTVQCQYDTEPTTHAHQEYCDGNSAHSKMRVWSIY